MQATILIAGGSGLIGQRLIEYLSDDYCFHVLSRTKRPNGTRVKYFQWDTARHTMNLAALENVDVVINLAGAGIADKRWTVARKEEILTSRVNSIETLAAALIKVKAKPSLYIGASAIGYYGDSGGDIKTESDSTGKGFLAEISNKWEQAQNILIDHFTRTVLLRIGIVLSKNGGALKEILKPAALGGYGYFGDGTSYYSWIHIDDICKIITEMISDNRYSGIYNATAPEPITIKELVKAVKSAKGGFGVVMPVPQFALKLILGEMTQMLMDSMRVVPKRLLEADYAFEFMEPVAAIRDILQRRI